MAEGKFKTGIQYMKQRTADEHWLRLNWDFYLQKKIPMFKLLSLHN